MSRECIGGLCLYELMLDALHINDSDEYEVDNISFVLYYETLALFRKTKEIGVSWLPLKFCLMEV